EVKSWLTSPAIGQEIIAETEVDGQITLVTHGDQSKDQVLQSLQAHGENLKYQHKAAGFSDYAWPLRSALGLTGQVLQLSSSLLRGKRDANLFYFAVTNLVANGINIMFGAQKSEDLNRLRFLKKESNTHLRSYVKNDSVLP